MIGEAALILTVGAVVDLATERARLAKEIERLADDIGKIDRKLGNEQFIAKAKPEVVEEQRERRAQGEQAGTKGAAGAAGRPGKQPSGGGQQKGKALWADRSRLVDRDRPGLRRRRGAGSGSTAG